MRRALLVVTAVATLVEGVVIAGGLFVVSAVIGSSSMSLDGSDPATVRVALWVVAGVVALGFLGVAVLLAVGRPRRGWVVAVAAVQGVLAVVAGIVSHGWAFAYALAVCGLYLGVLFAEPDPVHTVPAPR